MVTVTKTSAITTHTSEPLAIREYLELSDSAGLGRKQAPFSDQCEKHGGKNKVTQFPPSWVILLEKDYTLEILTQ